MSARIPFRMLIVLGKLHHDALEAHLRFHTTREGGIQVIHCECGETVRVSERGTREGAYTSHLSEKLADVTVSFMDKAWHEGFEAATNRPLYGGVPRSPYA